MCVHNSGSPAWGVTPRSKFTLMCLSIGTPINNKFPFVPNGKFIIFRCPKIWANYSLIITCSNTGTPNNHHFLFRTNGKVVVLGVPILKHFRVYVSPCQELLSLLLKMFREGAIITYSGRSFQV